MFNEAREILQELPVGLIFDSTHISEVWIEVVDRTITFLSGICQGLALHHHYIMDVCTQLYKIIECKNVLCEN